jgi:hypothetical protein
LLIELGATIDGREVAEVGGFTPLLYAVDRDAYDVRVLNWKSLPISCVVYFSFQAAECLLYHGADPNGPETLMGMTPLHVAAKKGLVPLAKLLLSRGECLSSHHIERRAACSPVPRPLIYFSLGHTGCDVHKRDNLGHNASYWAKEFKHTDVATLPGMPDPHAPLAEEVTLAFTYGHAHALATNPRAFPLPVKYKGVGGKKTAAKGKAKGKRK